MRDAEIDGWETSPTTKITGHWTYHIRGTQLNYGVGGVRGDSLSGKESETLMEVWVKKKASLDMKRGPRKRGVERLKRKWLIDGIGKKRWKRASISTK